MAAKKIKIKADENLSENKHGGESMKEEKLDGETIKEPEADVSDSAVKEELKAPKAEKLKEPEKPVEQEEPEPVEPEPVEPEKCSKPKETADKESLTLEVIREAREELSKVYKQNEKLAKEISTIKSEKLSLEKEIEVLKLSSEKLSNEVKKFKEAEQLSVEKIKNDKLESLSKKLEKIGKTISIESLSKLDNNGLEQLEEIVSDLGTPERLTTPAGTVKDTPAKVEKLSAKPKPITADFYKGICESLASQQGSGKKTMIL